MNNENQSVQFGDVRDYIPKRRLAHVDWRLAYSSLPSSPSRGRAWVPCLPPPVAGSRLPFPSSRARAWLSRSFYCRGGSDIPHMQVCKVSIVCTSCVSDSRSDACAR